MEDKNLKILEEINQSLKEINIRQKIDEEFLETNKIIEKVDRRVEHSTNQIQNSFDRIHDKVFNFNNILIGAFMVLGTFPSELPIINLWTVCFPIANLIFLICLEIRQMGIHRFTAHEKEWTVIERENYGKKVNSQNLLSLLSFGLSFGCLIYLIIKII
ncbi:MAG: hypothetical protein ACSHWW_02585 [Nonlabens sp.]|uniref:hypothetical protein n=1 Tax=Nonlabens sp. TaxID=1888209 RepID=UPI003EF098C6